jgi:hypothetical protein
MNDLPIGPSGDTCYACDQPATTKEHAPPKSFFPEGRRRNLITVPSCAIHNCDNAPDVEYVRNAIASLAGLNETGELLIDTAKRSFDHSPALFERTFRSFVVRSPEEQVGTYKFDLKRVDTVMEAVVQALHYRDQGQKWGRWQVFVPSLGSESSLIHENADGSDKLRDLLSHIPYVDRCTAEPEVFMYGSHALDWGWVYRLTFYGGFLVNAWMLCEDADGPYDTAIESGQIEHRPNP